MATWDDVREIALALPETAQRDADHLDLRVRGKGFVWERPLRKTDLAQLGDAAPRGPILAARVADEGVKQALIATDPAVYFTIPHFDGWPAVLVLLDRIAVDELRELITDAWLVQAPKRVARQFLADQG